MATKTAFGHPREQLLDHEWTINRLLLWKRSSFDNGGRQHCERSWIRSHSPPRFLILSKGLGNSARQQKAALSQETSAVEVKLRGPNGKPTISQAADGIGISEISRRTSKKTILASTAWMALALKIANQKWNFIENCSWRAGFAALARPKKGEVCTPTKFLKLTRLKTLNASIPTSNHGQRPSRGPSPSLERRPLACLPAGRAPLSLLSFFSKLIRFERWKSTLA